MAMRMPKSKSGDGTVGRTFAAPTLRNCAKDGAPSEFTKRAGDFTKSTGEEGYILLAVLFMVVMVLITLSIAAPKIAADIQRDREVELQHRGKQYVRAIKMYYKKFGAYPPNIEALEKSNEIRFLRKRYKDPMTGKDDWHMIHFGENKTPSYGFFGQPLGGTGGSTVAGVGPGGVGQNIGGSIFGSNGAGSGPIGGSSFGGGSAGGYGSGSNTGSNTDPNAGSGANTGGNSSSPTDPNAPSGGTGSGSSFMSGSSNGNGQTFGGGGIIGVESTNPKATILEYKKKKHFNEWEFWYDPNADRMMVSGGGSVGQPMSGAGNSSTPPSPGFGPSTGGGGGGYSSQPSPPTPPPQQPPTQQQ
jgi:type II secretory pathway pseudopilin PulG